MSQYLVLLLETHDEVIARRIVADIGTPQRLRAFDRLAAEARARRMLAEGKELSDVAHRLKARYDVSIETAYRWIREMEKA